VWPSRLTAIYLLLLGIQRGHEAQAAAVDWILARDWAAAGSEEEDASSTVDLTGGSQQQSDGPAGDSSSLDTQQLLGSTAAEAMRLADTASSRAKQNPSYQAAQARQRAAQQRADASGAAAGRGAVAAGPEMELLVRTAIQGYVNDAQMDGILDGFDDLVAELAQLTGLPEETVEAHLDEVRDTLLSVGAFLANVLSATQTCYKAVDQLVRRSPLQDSLPSFSASPVHAITSCCRQAVSQPAAMPNDRGAPTHNICGNVHLCCPPHMFLAGLLQQTANCVARTCSPLLLQTHRILPHMSALHTWIVSRCLAHACICESSDP
jgi:hypothetical protein